MKIPMADTSAKAFHSRSDIVASVNKKSSKTVQRRFSTSTTMSGCWFPNAFQNWDEVQHTVNVLTDSFSPQTSSAC